MLLSVERAYFAVDGPIIKGKLQGMMGFADECSKDLYEHWGLITVYANLQMRCKVCNYVAKGFDATNHLQTKDHVAKRKELEQQVTPIHELYCEGCSMLMKEENPYNDCVEQVCRLGYFHAYKDIDGNPEFDYLIDEELWRPQMCKEKH